MSRETRIFFSRLIIAVVFALSILSAVIAHFLITLITVAGGMLGWLLYLLSAGLGTGEDSSDSEGSLGRNLSKVFAGLGIILAISAFVTYGLVQTMWGSYVFNIQGLAAAMLILVISIAPLAILQLSRTNSSATSGSSDTGVAYPDAGQPLPAQPYYPAPYPVEEEYDEEEEYLDDDEKDEDEDLEEEDEEWDDDEDEEEDE